MRITRSHLRGLVRDSLARVMIFESNNFSPTASEEASKINREAGISLNTDQAYWEELGVRTGEDLARSLMISNYSDTYKSIHGIRPRWVRFEDISFDEIQAMVEDLYKEAEESEEDLEDWSDTGEEYQEWEAMRDKVAAEEAEEKTMMTPEEGEELPKAMGMGRRPLVGPARGVRRGRKISEEKHMKVTRRQLRKFIFESINEKIGLEEEISGDHSDYYDQEGAPTLTSITDDMLKGIELEEAEGDEEWTFKGQWKDVKGGFKKAREDAIKGLEAAEASIPKRQGSGKAEETDSQPQENSIKKRLMTAYDDIDSPNKTIIKVPYQGIEGLSRDAAMSQAHQMGQSDGAVPNLVDSGVVDGQMYVVVSYTHKRKTNENIKVTKSHLRSLIKEEYKSFLRETQHRRPGNYHMGTGSQWYSQPGAWERYDKVVRDVSQWFSEDEEMTRQFLSDVMFMGFERAARENNLGADAQEEIRILLVNSGYLSAYGGWQLPDEDYPKILGYTDPVTGEAIKINVQTPNDMDDILDPLLRQHPDLRYSID